MKTLAILGTLAALYFGSTIFIPIVSGFFLFYLLDPIVDWAEQKKRISRTLSSVTLVIISVAISGLLAWILYGAVADVAKELPAYSKKIETLISDIQKKADTIRSNTTSVVPQNSNETPEDVQKVQVVGGDVGKLTSFALRGLGTIFSVLAAAFFVPLIALFLLLEKPKLGKTTAGLLGENVNSQHLNSEIVKMLKSFFLGNLIIGSIMAIVLIVLFSILGLKNSFSLGLVTGFLNLVPLIGPVISVVLPIAAALLQFNTPAPFIIITATIFFLHFFTANFVVPKIVGARVNLNATASTLSLLLWGFLWGAIGVLFAIPLTALLRLILENYPPTHKISRLLAG